MNSVSQTHTGAEADPSAASSAGQALAHVAIVTLIAVVAASLVLTAILLVLTR